MTVIVFGKNSTFNGILTAATGSSIGNLTLANGSITDSSGSISFGDGNITNVGSLSCDSIIVNNSSEDTLIETAQDNLEDLSGDEKKQDIQ